jgi:hypothetical protein
MRLGGGVLGSKGGDDDGGGSDADPLLPLFSASFLAFFAFLASALASTSVRAGVGAAHSAGRDEANDCLPPFLSPCCSNHSRRGASGLATCEQFPRQSAI